MLSVNLTDKNSFPLKLTEALEPSANKLRGYFTAINIYTISERYSPNDIDITDITDPDTDTMYWYRFDKGISVSVSV